MEVKLDEDHARSRVPVGNGYVTKDEFREVRSDDVTVQRLVEAGVVTVRDGADEPVETNETDETGEGDVETCQVEKSDGEICGRERPCRYHD